MLFPSWLSSITFFEGPSFLGLLTIRISPIDQCTRGVVGVTLSTKMNHFQRLNEVEELKILFRATHEYEKQASSRRPLPRDALVPTVQNRAGAR